MVRGGLFFVLAALGALPAGACIPDDESAGMFPAVAEFRRDEVVPHNKDEIGERIQLICRYLSKHPQDKVVVNGYTDKHGSHGNNRARGQGYATWVMRRMLFQGCTVSQISTVSYGDERPGGVKDIYPDRTLSKNRAEIRLIRAPVKRENLPAESERDDLPKPLC